MSFCSSPAISACVRTETGSARTTLSSAAEDALYPMIAWMVKNALDLMVAWMRQRCRNAFSGHCS
jgi:hypothetical protein